LFEEESKKRDEREAQSKAEAKEREQQMKEEAKEREQFHLNLNKMNNDTRNGDRDAFLAVITTGFNAFSSLSKPNT
jgi:hypothetical protein